MAGPGIEATLDNGATAQSLPLVPFHRLRNHRMMSGKTEECVVPDGSTKSVKPAAATSPRISRRSSISAMALGSNPLYRGSTTSGLQPCHRIQGLLQVKTTRSCQSWQLGLERGTRSTRVSNNEAGQSDRGVNVACHHAKQMSQTTWKRSARSALRGSDASKARSDAPADPSNARPGASADP